MSLGDHWYLFCLYETQFFHLKNGEDDIIKLIVYLLRYLLLKGTGNPGSNWPTQSWNLLFHRGGRQEGRLFQLKYDQWLGSASQDCFLPISHLDHLITAMWLHELHMSNPGILMWCERKDCILSYTYILFRNKEIITKSHSLDFLSLSSR